MFETTSDLIAEAKRRNEEFWKEVKEKILGMACTYGSQSVRDAIRKKGGGQVGRYAFLIPLDLPMANQLHMSVSEKRLPVCELQRRSGSVYNNIDVGALSDDDASKCKGAILKELGGIESYLEQTYEKM
jgi:hypothetical protein